MDAAKSYRFNLKGSGAPMIRTSYGGWLTLEAFLDDLDATARARRDADTIKPQSRREVAA